MLATLILLLEKVVSALLMPWLFASGHLPSSSRCLYKHLHTESSSGMWWMLKLTSENKRVVFNLDCFFGIRCWLTTALKQQCKVEFESIKLAIGICLPIRFSFPQSFLHSGREAWHAQCSVIAALSPIPSEIHFCFSINKIRGGNAWSSSAF